VKLCLLFWKVIKAACGVEVERPVERSRGGPGFGPRRAISHRKQYGVCGILICWVSNSFGVVQFLQSGDTPPIIWNSFPASIRSKHVFIPKKSIWLTQRLVSIEDMSRGWFYGCLQYNQFGGHWTRYLKGKSGCRYGQYLILPRSVDQYVALDVSSLSYLVVTEHFQWPE
jgi:hypothetical protein